MRLPAIGRRIFAENDLAPAVAARIAALIDEIPHAPLTPIADSAPDTAAWNDALTPYAGATWLSAPWFVAETYFYRRIVAATGFFAGGPDPFALQKRLGLTVAAAPIAALADRLDEWIGGDARPALAPMLAIALWGNQADLSLWPADGERPAAADVVRTDGARVVVDDSARVEELLERSSNRRIDLVADNAGFELVCDLALIDRLLRAGYAEQVVTHVKLHPTFVSDATEADVRATIAHLAAAEHTATQKLGERLRTDLAEERIILRTHPFWTSPLAGWEMPADLRAELAGAALVVSKGDANYRRWLGDRRWPHTTPFSTVLAYAPASMLALRTCKSDVCVGLEDGRNAALVARDADWMTNGQWGVIQLHTP
jgi:uncharacterized protein with ATP-grasp and redox domains